MAGTAEVFGASWARAMHASYGTVLPTDSVSGRYDDILKLTESYYDPRIRTKQTDVGGATHLGRGYGRARFR